MAVAKHLDLGVLALALLVVLVAGLPFAGWLTAAVAWLAQKAIKEVSERRALEIARRSTDGTPRSNAETIADMRKVAGLTAGSMVGRGWLCALAIFGGWFIAGRDDDVGLTAALVVIACFTAYFVTTLILRPFATTPTNELPT